MSSGNKQIFVPARQRVYSSDINRLQQFASADWAEFLAFMMLGTTVDDSEGNGLLTLGQATTNPLTAMVINGLVFQPGVATANANVSAGILAVIDPDVSPSVDDSNFKYIRDPGTTANLVLTPNASGSTRIDIVEVQRANTIVETATVDIMDPTTGVFSPQTATKAIKSTLTYRIRVGTGGAGFPGTASGWLPIAVCSVPNGATVWDTCTIWDVRPLAGDLVHTPFQALNGMSNIQRGHFQLNTANTVDNSTLYPMGHIESQLNGWRIGGTFFKAAQQANLNLMTSSFIAPGSNTFGASHAYAVYLAFPHGLPRWVWYSTSTAGVRKPNGPRGYPIIANAFPTSLQGKIASLGMPTGLGFTGASNVSSGNLICVAAGFCDPSTGNVRSMVSDGRMQLVYPGSASVQAANVLTGQVNWVLTAGTHFPANARRVRLQFALTGQFTGQAAFIVSTWDAILSTNSPFSQITAEMSVTSNANVPAYGFTVDVPIQTTWPNSLVTNQFRISVDWSGFAIGNVPAIGTVAQNTVAVIGWDLGP